VLQLLLAPLLVQLAEVLLPPQEVVALEVPSGSAVESLAFLRRSAQVFVLAVQRRALARCILMPSMCACRGAPLRLAAVLGRWPAAMFNWLRQLQVQLARLEESLYLQVSRAMAPVVPYLWKRGHRRWSPVTSMSLLALLLLSMAAALPLATAARGSMPLALL